MSATEETTGYVGAPVKRFADSTGPLEGLDNPEYKGPSAA